MTNYGGAAGADRLSSHEQTLLEGTEGKVLVFALGGTLFFGMANAISRQHAVLPDHEVLIMAFTDVPTLGVSPSLALEKLILDAVHADHIISTRKTALEQAAIAMKQRDHPGKRTSTYVRPVEGAIPI